MLYTTEWVAEKYNYYNQLIWGGQLPPFNSIQLSFTKSRRTWGQAGTLKWRRDYNGIPQPTAPVLRLSNYYDAPEWAKLNTLVHEMCHLYEVFCEPQYILDVFKYNRYTHHYPRHGHGTVFYEQAARVEAITQIQIKRFVDQERLASAVLSDETVDRFNKSLERNGGKIYVFLFGLTRKGSNHGERYGYAKMGNLELWKKELPSLKEYFDTALLCSTTNPQVNNLAARRTIRWNIVPEVKDLIEKYNLKPEELIYGDESIFPFNNTNETEDAQQTTQQPQEKRYRSFVLKMTSGRNIKFDNVTKPEIENKLRELFPKWPDSTIEKVLNNQNNFQESVNMEKEEVQTLIETMVKNEMRRKIRKQETPEIEPFTDEEMDRLANGFVITN